MIYPHTATLYAYSAPAGKAVFTKGASFPCQAEMSPSRTKTATGAVTTADSMVFCALKHGVTTKKQDRLYVDKGNGIFDVLEIIKPEPAGRTCEIFSKLIPTAKVDPVTGVMS